MLHRVPTRLRAVIISGWSADLDLCDVPMFAKEFPESGLVRFWG